MCLWLLTACLGLLPSSSPPSNIVVVQGVPAPIILPTAAATAATAATTATVMATLMPTPSRPFPIILPTSAPTALMPMMPVGPTGRVPIPVLTCIDSDVICVANPDDIATGSLPIDPRLGTTASSSAALLAPLITGYNAQAPSFDTAVRFPRQRRSVKKAAVKYEDIDLSFIYSMSAGVSRNHRIVKRQSCMCVPSGTCIRTGTNAGAGLIDFRIVTPGGSSGQCPAGQEYCCTGTTTQIACGTIQAVPAVAVTPAAGQANFGEYPWQAIILTKQNEYIGGGVLIDSRHVLTVTHRLLSYVVSGTAPNVKVRLGEWDAAGTYEPVPFQEYTVQRVFPHPSYNPNTLQYDIMVLRLATTVPFSPAAGAAVTINRACLPPSATTSYVGQRCWVSGWGKNMFGTQGQYQQILKKVDVPIVASATCQSQMQTARLGASFVLDTTSFICAGGEPNKDSCTGDGGSGLVCSVNGQWVLVGLVAWGLGCANANVPAAYVNVAALLPWIQQQVATA